MTWLPHRAQSRFISAAAALVALLVLLPLKGGDPRAATRLEDTRRQLDSLSRAQDAQRSRLVELGRQEEGGIQRLDRLEQQGSVRRNLRRQLEQELQLLLAGQRQQAEALVAGAFRLDSLGGQRQDAGRERERVRKESINLARKLFPLRRLDALGLWLQSASRNQAERSLRRVPWLVRGLQARLSELADLHSHLGKLEERERDEERQRRGLLAELERDRRRTGQARAEATAELARLQNEQAEQGRLLASLKQDRRLAAEQADRLRRAGESVALQMKTLEQHWAERERRLESETHRQDAVAGRLAAARPGETVPPRPGTSQSTPPPRAPALVPIESPPLEGPAPAGGLEGRRGRLPAPVHGRVTRPFGERHDPLLGTVLDNPGIDFSCAPGSPVRAVHDGRVDKLTWVAGFGNTLLLSHGEACWTVYAKLDEVAVRQGQSVRAGQILGAAGRFDAPDKGALHFELWQNQRPCDPGLWLKP